MVGEESRRPGSPVELAGRRGRLGIGGKEVCFCDVRDVSQRDLRRGEGWVRKGHGWDFRGGTESHLSSGQDAGDPQ